jgi:hypothetical protein
MAPESRRSVGAVLEAGQVSIVAAVEQDRSSCLNALIAYTVVSTVPDEVFRHGEKRHDLRAVKREIEREIERAGRRCWRRALEAFLVAHFWTLFLRMFARLSGSVDGAKLLMYNLY